MLTIYERETGFESLDTRYSKIKAYVEDAVGQTPINEVEKDLFRQLQPLGRGLLEAFVAQSGTGYEAGNPPVSEEGVAMEYKETPQSPYVSIFGEIRIARASYAHPEGGRVYPLDGPLNLPDHKYSYVLLKWLQAASADQDYRRAVDRFNEIFDCSFFPELPQRQGKSVAAYVESFYSRSKRPVRRRKGAISPSVATARECVSYGGNAKRLKRSRLRKPGVAKGKNRGSRKRRWWSPTSPSIPRRATRKRSSKACSINSPKKRKSRLSRNANSVAKPSYPSLGSPTTSTSLPPWQGNKPPSSICWTMWPNAISTDTNR